MKTKLLTIIVLLCLSLAAHAQKEDSTRIYLEQGRARYTYDFFDDGLSDWHSASVGLNFTNYRWKIIPSITGTQRFDKQDILLEVDSYLNLKNRDYINFNGGYSFNHLYPDLRVGIEYFNPFKKVWEHSVGFTYFQFEEAGSIYLLTSSISRYYGAHLSILRASANYSAQQSKVANYSGQLTHRYYLGDFEYIGAFVAYGFDAKLYFIQDNVETIETNPSQLSMGVSYQSDFSRKKNQWSVGYTWTKYEFVQTQRIQHTIIIQYYLNMRK